jgi:2,3-bisphosphoglycerate-independent phosphoglycerate mutase
MKRPLILTIMDGYGLAPAENNAIAKANTPNIDKIFSENPITQIEASGLAVGLPEGQMGNSEVGHTNIGAGRVVYQDLTRITKSIKDGDFFENVQLNEAVENAIKNNSALHLLGLLSDGGVHSHITHMYAVLKLAKKKGLKEVYVHAFLDGRDVAPTSGAGFIADTQKEMEEIGVGKIATVMGRYYAMDRDNRYERVEKAYAAMVYGEGAEETDPAAAVRKSYEDGVTDEFVLPMVIKGGKNISKNDSVIFYNFRPDRAREITRTLVDDEFAHFERRYGKFNLCYVCMTEYDATIKNVKIAFALDEIKNTLGEYIAANNLKQLRIAETEKYAHVTFFFNGGLEKPYDNEDRILVSSPKVATYDLQPEMSEPEVAVKVVEAIKSLKYDVIILNFANCDMVGHTGIFEAAVKAVEAVDEGVGKVYEAIKAVDGIMLITADHGNAEKMYDEKGEPFTAHTTNLVPFCVVNHNCKLSKGGKLADIAPTMLHILNLVQPKEMTGKSLIVE